MLTDEREKEHVNMYISTLLKLEMLDHNWSFQISDDLLKTANLTFVS